MYISIEADDMMHIVKLLREDMMGMEHYLEEEPDSIEAAQSLAMSKQVMLKIAACAILKGQKNGIINDPYYISSRADLN
tara:strand:+ start:361 stop:597 length:237 start_codon:yes stop_codon:yes gene_type:complete